MRCEFCRWQPPVTMSKGWTRLPVPMFTFRVSAAGCKAAWAHFSEGCTEPCASSGRAALYHWSALMPNTQSDSQPGKSFRNHLTFVKIKFCLSGFCRTLDLLRLFVRLFVFHLIFVYNNIRTRFFSINIIHHPCSPHSPQCRGWYPEPCTH